MCPFLLAIILIILCCLFDHAAGTHIALLIVGLGGVTFSDTTMARGVNELEMVLIDLGNYAHMTHALATGTAVEEHEVARLEFVACDAASVVDLSTRSAVEAETETLEHIAGEAGAVKTTRTCLTIAVGHAFELEGEIEKILYLTVAGIIVDGGIP